jgi:hypothetical protein
MLIIRQTPLRLTLLASLGLSQAQAQTEESLLAVYCLNETDTATIVIDGKTFGECSETDARQIFSLSVGQHSIEVTRPISDQYERKFSKDVTLAPGVPTQLKVNMPEPTLTALGIQQQQLAFQQTLQAANQGDLDAMEKVADAYQNGTGTTADTNQAEHWKNRASAIRTKQQNEKAFTGVLQKANTGDTDAMRTLINYYSSGYGTEVNSAEADQWQKTLTQSENQARLNQRRTALENRKQKYMPMTSKLFNDNPNPGSSEITTLSISGLPFSLVTDLVATPFTSTQRSMIDSEIDNLEAHATRWAKPDSLVAQSFSGQHTAADRADE